MKELTQRQEQILELIKNNLELKGFPPTRADIANTFGFKSPNAAEQHLRALEKKGVISILSGASRGIVLKESHTPKHLKNNEIPIIGLVAAGQPMLALEHVEKKLKIPETMFRDNADYLLRVKGDSMIDLGIHEEDLIAVKKEKECKIGQIIVARVNDEVTVKTFSKNKEGKIILKAANKKYSDITLDPKIEDFYLEGVCLGVIKSF
tara:strand:+ start:83 stop:703 length:621 start_codon:yes stop_codon:yes gene_type:complete